MKIVEVRTTKRGRLLATLDCGHEVRAVSAAEVACGKIPGGWKRYHYNLSNMDAAIRFRKCPVKAHAKRRAS